MPRRSSPRRARLLTGALASLSLTLALTAAGTAPATATPSDSPHDSADTLRSALGADDTARLEARVAESADGPVEVQRDDASGRVEWVTALGGDLAHDRTDDLPEERPAATTPRATTVAWLDDQTDLFGVPREQLRVGAAVPATVGSTVTATQWLGGVPVWGSALKFNLDPQGRLLSVNGHVVPALNLDTRPHLSASTAEAVATRAVTSDPPTTPEGAALPVQDPSTSSALVVYELGAAAGQGGSTAAPASDARLAWEVTVRSGDRVNERVIVDDRSAILLNRWSQTGRASGPDRVLETWTGDAGTPGDVRDDPWSPTWREGQEADSLTSAQANLLDTTSETYWFFRNAFGFDSWDGAGAPMRIRDEEQTDACPNAMWTGEYVSVCAGLENDDVVAHEWGHAYTDGTSGLIYQWQAGALNESYSDVWGETIDLLNDRDDAGETTTRRTTATCGPRRGSRVQITAVFGSSDVWTCASAVAGTYTRAPAAPMTVHLVAGRDGTGASSRDGCSALTNEAAVAGHWVYLERGACTYATQIDNAAQAGATGVILGHLDALTVATFTDNGRLPAYLVSLSDAVAFRKLSPSATTPVLVGALDGRGTSSRWQIGEQSLLPNGALRDMWNPNCLGDPASVADAQYHCGEDDNGGVHINSGVPNRAYSLLVDGGTHGGQSVSGLGLDRAAHLWWSVGASYLTPAADFADFGAALSTACRRLVGHDLPRLSLTAVAAPGSVRFTLSDCTQVDRAVRATGLNDDPVVRCAARPFFSAGAPAGCGGGFTSATLLTQTFDQGWAGWSTSRTHTSSPGPSAWQISAKAPGSSSPAAFVRNDHDERCGGSTGVSRAGLSSLVSPPFTVPASARAGSVTRVRWRHALALQGSADGALVRVQVNAGAWRRVPATAFELNAPNGRVLPTARRDNPLLGEAAWTGTRSQTLSSGWGTSVLNLTRMGVTPGSTVRLRFDLGTDTCGGWEGWYVDDVVATVCLAPAPPSRVQVTARVKPGTVRRGRPVRVPVTVVADRPVLGGVRGTVQVRVKGRVVGSARLRPSAQRGRAVVTVRAVTSGRWRPGRYVAVVRYSGSTQTQSGTVRVRFRVR